MLTSLYTPHDVKGSVVWITGATAGIGEACAWRFAEAGAQLLILGRRSERLAALKDALAKAYPATPPVVTLSLDVQDVGRITNIMSELPGEVSAPDVLVNNAGLALGVNPCWANKAEDVVTMLTTNVAAVITMTSIVLPGMRARGCGHIINIGSIAGHEAYAGGSVYCATKFAVDAFTTASRHDLVGTPIRVSAVSPGMVNTEFSTVRLGDKEAADKVYGDLEALVAADIADNVMYVATRPKHVQIGDIIVWPTNQAGSKNVARPGASLGGPC